MGYSHGSLEDQNVHRNVDSGGLAHEVSEGNKDSDGNWARNHLCYILAKNLVTFYLCTENFT